MSESFDAVCLVPEGWTVLSPPITTLTGDHYRQHCGEFGQNEAEARHVAAQLNAARPEREAK